MKQTPYPASDFNLPDDTGEQRQLADYRGRWLVLYFYPKDDTPGCTTEACSFRDTHSQVAELDATVVGVSRDDTASHAAFKKKHGLGFTLLTDADHRVMEVYGAWKKGRLGVFSVLRKTFIIDPSGQIVKAYDRVTPSGHGEQIADDLSQLQTSY